MEKKLPFELEQTSIEEEDGRDDDHEFYETIEAPKFVDFTRPNHYCPDDRFWFCSRLGCDQKHEEELDPEAIYKDFVIRVMAARSPNVRFQRALSRKPLSDSKKCPMSAPPKSSKSRIPRLALVSSVSRKLLDDGEKCSIRPVPRNPATKPKPRVKLVPAKYMTSPKKKKGGSPKLNALQRVRSPKNNSITIQKNKVTAEALQCCSPKKDVKVKLSEMATPVTKLCEGVKKLTITSQKKGIVQKESVRKLLPSDASKKPRSIARKIKTRQEYTSCSKMLEPGSESSVCVKVKATKHAKKHDGGGFQESSIVEKSQRNLRSRGSNTSKKEPELVSDEGSSPTLTSELISVPDNKNSPTCQELNAKDQNKGNESSVATDLLNQNTGVVVELVDNEHKENVLKDNDIRNVNENILSKHVAIVKSKVKTVSKVQNGDKKSMKENCPAAVTQGVKYKKLKPTNPKPFRLRTDERGILKEATLEKKVNSQECSTVTSENSQCVKNEVSATREKDRKKTEDKTVKKVQFMPVKSKYKTSKENVPVSGTETCSKNTTGRKITRTLHKQSVRPQREIGSRVEPRVLGTVEKTKTSLKPKGSRQQLKEIALPRITPVLKEPTFYNLHKSKSCTRIV